MSANLSLEREARYAYPLAVALLATPLMDLFLRLWPVKAYLVQWRFQAEIALVSAAPALLLALLVCVGVAWLGASSGLLRLSAVAATIYGFALIPIVALMLMDSDQVQQMAAANVRGSLRNNTWGAMLKGMLSALAALSLGLGAWRLARQNELMAEPARGRGGSSASEEPDLLLVSDSRG
jgi:hypothetical protein